MIRKLAVITAGVAVLLLGGCADLNDDDLRLLQQEVSSSQINVFSINVRIITDDDTGEEAWSSRRGFVRRAIEQFDGGEGAHLVGLQELEAASYDYLKSNLDQYWRYWVDRGDGERIATFVRTDQFEVLDYGYAVMSRDDREDLTVFAGCISLLESGNPDRKPRAMQFVRVRDRYTDRVTSFFNAHGPVGNSCGKEGFAIGYAWFIRENARSGDRIVAVGDLNTGYTTSGSKESPFDTFLDWSGLTSSFAWHHDPDTSIHLTSNGFSKVDRQGRMIDHVLVSDPSEVLTSGVDYSLFTTDGSRIWCPEITHMIRLGQFPPRINYYCGDRDVDSLRLYSDHYGVFARLKP